MSAGVTMPGVAPGVGVIVDRFGYDGALLFDGFRLHLEGGRCTALLGPSGCGKSTLVRLIAGLVGPAAATADDGAPLEGRVAVMAQQDLLLPWLVARDNVLLGHRLRGLPRRERCPVTRRAEALLARVGLADHVGVRPGQLSGGMRQRVALARTLMEDRPIVLMDEPFSALDAITRHRLQDLAAELLQGRTVLLVTHSPLEALRLGHAVYVVQGRPACIGEPLVPPGVPPRDAASPALLGLQGRLLNELAGSPALKAAS